MYAHQVVSDLEKTFAQINPNKYPSYKKWQDDCIRGINQSIKFHIPDIEELSNVTNRENLVNTDIIKKYSKYLKLPYEPTWVDFPTKIYTDQYSNEIKEAIRAGFGIKNMAPVSKCAALLYEIKNEIIFAAFSFLNDHWETHLGVGRIDLNDGYFGASLIVGLKDELPHSLIKSYREFGIPQLNKIAFQVIGLLALLGCKNVTTKAIFPSKKLNKKRFKKNKLPLFEYKILEVINGESCKNISNGSGRRKRLHLCRGHFKEYTEDNPLFGKYTGLYWWQPHVRGNKKLGVIHKDYKIKTQEAA